MVYDTDRRRTLMLVQGLTQQLWSFDGVDWTNLWQGSGRTADQLIYDQGRQRLLAMGWTGLVEFSPTLAAVMPVGTPCGAALDLQVRSRPRVGATEFGFEADVRNAAGLPTSSQGVLFSLGLTTANLPIGGGCAIGIGTILATNLQFSDRTGLATQPVPLPFAASASLRGLVVTVQAATIDAAGVVGLSRVLQITVGD